MIILAGIKSVIGVIKKVVCLCGMILVLCSCGGTMKEGGGIDSLPWQDLREGDLLFRRGEGIASHFVLIADKGGVYSHIGILVRDGGRWSVVHAVPGEPDFKGDPDRVKLEPVERFFDRERAVCGAVMRVDCDSLLACRAAEHAKQLALRGVLFDHAYNRRDTTALYCTELVEFVFRTEGVDLAGEVENKLHVPGLEGENYLFPGDIAKSARVKCIWRF